MGRVAFLCLGRGNKEKSELMWIKEFKKVWKENKYNLILECFVVILGVFLGLIAEGHFRQVIENRATIARVKSMCSESKYNMSHGDRMFKNYSNIESTDFYAGRLDDYSVKVVLQDSNIECILSPEQIYIIQRYANEITSANSLNEFYKSYLGSIGYQATLGGKSIRKVMKENIAEFLAVNVVLQTKLGKFYSMPEGIHERIKATNKSIEDINTKILEGKFKVVEE